MAHSCVTFAAEISGQIGQVAKKHRNAKAYGHRTPCRMMLQKWRISAHAEIRDRG
jgi:hypothetical protein